MRIHTALTKIEVARCAARLHGVLFETLREHGSRSRPRAFEVHLSGSSPWRGQAGHADYAAATWDEWGVFLGELFERDPLARIAGVYEDATDFHWQTGHRFHPDDLPTLLCKRHRWECVRPFEHACSRKGCTAVTRSTPPSVRPDELPGTYTPKRYVQPFEMPPAAEPWTPADRAS